MVMIVTYLRVLLVGLRRRRRRRRKKNRTISGQWQKYTVYKLDAVEESIEFHTDAQCLCHRVEYTST
jgi:hypothetical protein